MNFTENVNVSAVFGAVFEPSNVISGVVSDSKTGEIVENVSLSLLREQGKPVLDESGNPSEIQANAIAEVRSMPILKLEKEGDFPIS